MKTQQSKWFGVSTAAIVLTGMLSACSSPTKEASPSASGGAATGVSKEPVTLRWKMFDRGNAPAGCGSGRQ